MRPAAHSDPCMTVYCVTGHAKSWSGWYLTHVMHTLAGLHTIRTAQSQVQHNVRVGNLCVCSTMTLASTAGLQAQAAGEEPAFQSPPLGFQDAMDEALVAVEQVVIPRRQPIELLPRTPELLDMQVSMTQVSLHSDYNCCCIFLSASSHAPSSIGYVCMTLLRS